MSEYSKEAVEEEMAALKAAYKEEKRQLEWVENDFEESLIRERMATLRQRLKELREAQERAALSGRNAPPARSTG